MKTWNTNRYPANSRRAAARTLHSLALTCALLGAACFAQVAMATCNPKISRSCAQPAQARSARPYEAKILDHSSTAYRLAGHPHSPTSISNVRRQDFHGPSTPGPRRDVVQSATRHGIIFVGGHSARTLDKNALNTQPIPPGHAARKIPHPGLPLENISH
jgi:hypothetical protein